MAPRYFADSGFEFTKYQNPADIFMKVLSINYPKKTNDVEKLDKLIQNYDKKQRTLVALEMDKSKLPLTL